MTSDEAFTNIRTIMKDCYDAFETLDNGDKVEWDTFTYRAMGDILHKVLTEYFMWDGY